MASLLKCPVCDRPLTVGSASATCDRGHAFDRARSGYLNLLLSHQKHSSDPGDSPAMLRSRRAILQAGLYEPIASATDAAISSVLSGRASALIADVGCGEGYFLDHLKRASTARARPRDDYYGVDISRNGIKMATMYDRDITWIVASLHDTPFMPQSLDVVLSMFSPIAVADVRRILRDDGAFVTVTPGPDHLDALRAVIYASVVPHSPTPALMVGDTTFDLSSSARVRFEAVIDSQQAVMDLLAMTPYYWHISRETKARVEACARLELTVDAYVNVFRHHATTLLSDNAVLGSDS